MIEVGQVTGSEVTKFLDGEENARVVNAELSEPDDQETVELVSPSGDDSPPREGTTVYVINISDTWRVAIAVDDGVEPSVEPGEKKLYSYDDAGAVNAYIHLKNDGSVEVNGNGDFAVRFNQLQIAFDQLKADFDQAMTYLNTHAHDETGVQTSFPMYPSPPFPAPGIQPSTADITPAKVDEVELSEYTP